MKLLLSLLIFCAGSYFTVSAQSPSFPENEEKQVDVFLSIHNEKRAQNPEGLLFTVTVKDNRKQFHFGEIIPLELSFAASKPETFTLDAATYDRSGRLHSDGFVLDQRDTAVDPIADYFDSGLNSFMLGGLRSIPGLTAKPHLITAELNEWQRIEKPGHYRLYVVTSRVGRKGGQGVFLFNGGSAAVSNVIEFDILPPEKKWSAQKLSEAVATLSKPTGDHNSACRTLRFLGTTAAATEMRKRFRGDDNRCEWEYKFGLIGSPHRNFVIRDMEDAISLREQPVTAHFLNTLALLEFSKRAPAAPPYAGENEEQFSQWQTQTEGRQRIYDELRLHYLRQLVIAIPQKQGQARATSLQTLLDFRSELNTSEFSQWSTLFASLPEVFNRLPLDDQLSLLKYQWKPIASAAMLPVLRDVFKYSYSTQQNEVFDVFQQEDLRSSALRRLYEVSPEEGRRFIIKEIHRPKPRVTEEVLRSLPDETLSELNTVLLSNFEVAHQSGSWHTDVISSLIERYATDEILSRVKAIYEARDAGKWECRTQAALLAYFLRVDPSVGGEYLKTALATREKGFPRCYTETLKNVAELQMSGEVEDIAIAALDDEDSAVVSQAASVLAKYGSADAEKPLWRRLENWRRGMQSRNEEPVTQELDYDQETIEKSLRQALTSGHAWLSDPEKLKRVRDLCITGQSREEIDRMISSWGYRLYVTLSSFDDESITINVANCEIKSIKSLKKKLLQFSKGTVFKWKTAPTRGDDSKIEELFENIKTFLTEHGMSLKRESER